MARISTLEAPNTSASRCRRPRPGVGADDDRIEELKIEDKGPTVFVLLEAGAMANATAAGAGAGVSVLVGGLYDEMCGAI